MEDGAVLVNHPPLMGESMKKIRFLLVLALVLTCRAAIGAPTWTACTTVPSYSGCQTGRKPARSQSGFAAQVSIYSSASRADSLPLSTYRQDNADLGDGGTAANASEYVLDVKGVKSYA
jgi:hypothetical protein